MVASRNLFRVNLDGIVFTFLGKSGGLIPNKLFSLYYTTWINELLETEVVGGSLVMGGQLLEGPCVSGNVYRCLLYCIIRSLYFQSIGPKQIFLFLKFFI